MGKMRTDLWPSQRQDKPNYPEILTAHESIRSQTVAIDSSFAEFL